MRPTALVTGAARRVGRAIALSLARAGFDVAVHYRSSRDEAEAVVEACAALGADAWSVRADLSRRAETLALASTVRARWPSLHALVNNASLFSPRAFDALDDARWDEMLEVNLTAPFLLSRELLGALSSAPDLPGAPEGARGVVVHLCDIGAERPMRGYTHYAVSKAGLVMMVKAMAVELAPTIRAVGVSPGHVAWPEDYDEATRERLRKRIPMKREGSPEDIAEMVRALICEAHYINGAIIPVDGGLSCRY